MKHDEHLPDQQLLLDVEGEISPHDERLVRAHLSACWKCRARRQELDNAITGFVRAHQREFEAKLPPAAGPRALLKAQLSQLSWNAAGVRSGWPAFPRAFAWGAALCGLLVFGFLFVRSTMERQNLSDRHALIVSTPDSSLTPGATLLASRPAVCAQENIKNKVVPIALQRKVFEQYGIAGADPHAYEVDYLVTPALGGADDIHNLWPHSYSHTVWNARVKDALEDRLREMVCDGSIDLAEAQREIATNWITAYKKYFHTDQPLAEHCDRCVE
ncbi:MAG TPA: hypothetical protein VK752_02250 [Bryobacteraceae bacterium]|jgi:hypothetical protein|nr:hypothetical protein [Bryobacteraceae bacterium]